MSKIQLPANYDLLNTQQRRLVREEYVRIQEGRCSHCGELLTGKASADVLSKSVNRRLFPEGFFRWPVHLHHNHTTSMTIGAVHNYCNAVLWQYYGE
jgi:hypothetical protein